MRKHFIQAVAVTVSSVLSIGVMISMTANAFAANNVSNNRDIVGLAKSNDYPYYEEETTEEPMTTLPEEEEDIDPMYLHSVVIYQPSVSNQGASVYSMSFLPDDGGVFTATIPDFGGSDARYELMVHRTTWIYPADDWIGDKNGNNIGFYAPKERSPFIMMSQPMISGSKVRGLRCQRRITDCMIAFTVLLNRQLHRRNTPLLL